MNKHEVEFLRRMIDDMDSANEDIITLSNENTNLSNELKETQANLTRLTNAVIENTRMDGDFAPNDPLYHYPSWVCATIPQSTLKKRLEESQGE